MRTFLLEFDLDNLYKKEVTLNVYVFVCVCVGFFFFILFYF